MMTRQQQRKVVAVFQQYPYKNQQEERKQPLAEISFGRSIDLSTITGAREFFFRQFMEEVRSLELLIQQQRVSFDRSLAERKTRVTCQRKPKRTPFPKPRTRKRKLKQLQVHQPLEGYPDLVYPIANRLAEIKRDEAQVRKMELCLRKIKLALRQERMKLMD